MGGCVNKTTVQRKPEQAATGPQSFVRIHKTDIKESYAIEKKIASGGFGSVFICKHLKTNQQRAVKFIQIGSKTKSEINNLLREVNTLREMDHPNIIKIYEVFHSKKFLNIVTELCTGGELFDRIEKESHFSENKAAEYMSQIVSTVVHLHAKGIVHRDLKPENLLFESDSPDSRLKLIDFGTCKHFANNEKQTERVGSPYYMAPEVITGNYNEKCDVWSLGIIMYILLSGEPPFNGRNDNDILSNIVLRDFKFKGRVWSKISDEAKELITAMLNKSVVKRITAKEVFQHSWFQKFTNKNEPSHRIAKSALKNLSKFTISNKLHRATLAFIVNQVMSTSEISSLRDTFAAFDKNGDGLLSVEELKEGMVKFSGSINFDINELLLKVDEDKNGCINYSEFLTAALNWEKELSRERLVSAFKQFDKDGSGSISVNELLEALGGSEGQEHMFLEMIREADANGDGEIDIDEFVAFMEKIKVDNRV